MNECENMSVTFVVHSVITHRKYGGVELRSLRCSNGDFDNLSCLFFFINLILKII